MSLLVGPTSLVVRAGWVLVVAVNLSCTGDASHRDGRDSSGARDAQGVARAWLRALSAKDDATLERLSWGDESMRAGKRVSNTPKWVLESWASESSQANSALIGRDTIGITLEVRGRPERAVFLSVVRVKDHWLVANAGRLFRD